MDIFVYIMIVLCSLLSQISRPSRSFFLFHVLFGAWYDIITTSSIS
jgi:hypothetical protein